MSLKSTYNLESLQGGKLTAKRHTGRLVGWLLAAGLAISAAGCVDSENEVQIRGPLMPECASLDPPAIEPLTYDDAKGLDGIFTINLAQVMGGQRCFGFDKTTGKCVLSPEKYVSFSLGLKNTLGSTTNYTKLGAGSELRIDQNGVSFDLIELEITEKPDNFPSSIEIKNHTSFVNLSSSSSTAGSGFVLLSEDEVLEWNNALVDAGLADTEFEIKIGIQFAGNLNSGYPISSSKIYLPVKVCTGTACNPTTPICTPKP